MIESIVNLVSFLLMGVGYFIAGIVVLVILAIIFGDQKLWEYEVQGHCDACENGKLKIEIQNLKKKGTSIEFKGRFKSEYLGKDIVLLLNGYQFHTFSAAENDGSNYKLEESLQIEEPQSGDTISVKIAEEEIFSQKLYKD